MSNIVLLGPQRLPTVGRVLDELGIEGPVAVISAGWQEREGETQDLEDHLKRHAVDLRLYRLLEDVFQSDQEFFCAHRQKQDRLRQLQKLYRIRLAFAMKAVRALQEIRAEPDLVRRERREAIAAVRNIDRAHLKRIDRVQEGFAERWNPAGRASVLPVRRRLDRHLSACEAILVAGGHVLVLLNRIRLLGLSLILPGKPLIAWSAGAMVLSERIVLFHDRPPQGAGDAEVVDRGLGVIQGIVPLPDARTRLMLDHPDRVSLLARRFAPSCCATLDEGAILPWVNNQPWSTRLSFRLTRSGGLRKLEVA